MCGRYTLRAPAEEIYDEFGLEGEPKAVEPHYNVAPTMEVPIITTREPKTLTFVRWGMIPFWAKDPSAGNRFVNVRVETLRDKGSFHRVFDQRRCLVVADGFYEWKHTPGKGKKKIATPMYVRVPGEKIFAFAGLYDGWRAPDGTIVRSATILTVPSNAQLEPIHDRMPVILPKDVRQTWLESQSHDELLSLLVPYEKKLEIFEVSKLVNKPENDSPECIAPVG